MLLVGIDLGTSNCAVAFADPAAGPDAPIVDLPIPQLVRPGEVAPRALLPSFLYLPSDAERASGGFRLPWEEATAGRVVGELARWQGARVPGRVVASAKSWLCHGGVDRQSPILPWGAPPEVGRVSPVEASAAFLRHVAAAWSRAHPTLPLAEQEVVVTVPASFDEAARALTVSAARAAGLERFTLLEEPQAAFYDFTARHRRDLAAALAGVRLVLVVDVGGGTTDFTLVQVEALPEGPAMRRLAVGDHLMLGGDNMDAALAHRLEEKLGRKLSAAQWQQLVQMVRGAKEALLGGDARPDRFPVSLASEGSRLVGGVLSAELTREEVVAATVEGFFPATSADETPQRSARGALQELGLPYAADPAITRHLAAFLRAHAQAAKAVLGEEATGPFPRPDAILVNGGVFNSPVLTGALVERVSAWWPDRPKIPLLPHASLDAAVARGAAYYALTRRGLGRRIGGGAARSYYVGVSDASTSGAARAVCLVPRGAEEGQTFELTQRSFALGLGRPVQFQLHSTTADRVDRPGDVVDVDPETFVALPPIHALLVSSDPKRTSADVHLATALTEIGTLELACVTPPPAPERWRLEFELRGTQGRGPLAVTESMPARFAEATEWVQRVFGHRPLPIGPKDVKQLSRTLEKVLGPREAWRLPVLRELWGALFAGASKRRRSPDHERVFFGLLGYALRPGAGYPLDAWRAEQTFRLFGESVQHHGETAVWMEFWILWRRIAAGLDDAAQGMIWAYLAPHLARRVPPNAPKAKEKLKGVVPEGLDEMVRTAASLEHLDAAEKERIGGWIAERLADPASPQGGPWAWALGRLGARVPLHGSLHRVVAPEIAAAWAEQLIAADLRRIDGAPFAVAQLARLTGDRARDLEPGVRARVATALTAASALPGWVALVTEVGELSAADEARALGDTLPAGLSL